MKKLQPPGEYWCEEIRSHLDSYVSNESAPELSQQIVRHVEGCSACAAELETRTRLRAQLKSAVERQYVPRDLQVQVRDRIRGRQSRPWWTAGWNWWAVATAASLVIGVGLWLNYSRVRMPALSDRPAQDFYIQKVSASLMPTLKVGLRDHIHCSVFRKYPKNPPTVAQMVQDLGPSYKDLLELTKAALTDRYRVIMAHQCGYAGRKYVHLTLKNNGELVSLVITRKNAGESLADLAPAMNTSGIPVYQSVGQGYKVAAFDAGDYLAFVISDLATNTNLQIASRLAPTVQKFLTNLPA